MLEIFKKLFGKEKSIEKSVKSHKKPEKELAEPKWYQVGKGSPYDQDVLDIRCITLNVVAVTEDKSIAENFNITRSENGKRFTDVEITDSKLYKVNLRYPHNGAELNGVVYKADSMDIKWDIYAYSNYFYFVRSWTSELVYKVHFENLGNELFLDEIETNLDDDGVGNLHEQNINSLLLTHVMGKVWPYIIKPSFQNENEHDIAVYLFSRFGNKATIATFADTLKLKQVKNK